MVKLIFLLPLQVARGVTFAFPRTKLRVPLRHVCEHSQIQRFVWGRVNDNHKGRVNGETDFLVAFTGRPNFGPRLSPYQAACAATTRL